MHALKKVHIFHYDKNVSKAKLKFSFKIKTEAVILAKNTAIYLLCSLLHIDFQENPFAQNQAVTIHNAKRKSTSANFTSLVTGEASLKQLT